MECLEYFSDDERKSYQFFFLAVNSVKSELKYMLKIPLRFKG